MATVVLPFSPEDIALLEGSVRESDPFLAISLDTDDPYCLLDHAEAGQGGRFRIHALFDRNLISRIAHLAAGAAVDVSNPSAAMYRLAAGCMVYLLLGDALIEPSLSLYEYSDRHGSTEANVQLFHFRVADHVDPRAWFAVAVGRADRLDPAALDEARLVVATRRDREPTYDFTKRLDDVTKHAISLTKIAWLERTPIAGIEKLRRFLHFCYEDAFFNGAAIAFALLYFGRNRPGRMLKRVRSRSYERCHAGIRNAAWDLAYLSFWLRKAAIENPHVGWILCTRDLSLLEIGRRLAGPLDAETQRDALQAILVANWSEQEAAEISHLYDGLTAMVGADRAARDEELKSRPPADALLEILERDLRQTFSAR